MPAKDYRPEGLLMGTRENREALCRAGLSHAMETGRILEARALLCDEHCNLEVDLCGLRGIIPRAETVLCPDGAPIRDIAIITRVGKPVCFKVTGLTHDDDGPLYLLSRREAQRECAGAMLQALLPGDVIDARVTHLENFGCFVDIGCGLTSLITIDNISVSRISHPRDRFFTGEYIKAVVKGVQLRELRVTLSHKELLGTWEQNVARLCVGQTAAGIIRSVESYGVFVELAPNLAGLAEWRDGAIAGQQAAVYIKNIIPEKMKVKLILIDSFFDDAPPRRSEYFITGGRISRWRYTPDICDKVIETVFE